jgi:hypothetical protein
MHFAVKGYKDKVFSIWKKQKPTGYFSGVKDGVAYESVYIQEKKTKKRTENYCAII